MSAAVDLVCDYAEWVRTHRAAFYEPQNWQRELYRAGAEYPHRLVSAANQCGKTLSACYETRCHLTGDYPDWWDGATFDHPPLAWAAGVNAAQIVDVLQKTLFGSRDGNGFDGNGLIEPERIVSVQWSLQRSDLADRVKVRHRKGVSTLLFKAYSSTGAEKKKAQALAGTTRLDWLLVDEQPPLTALGQMIQRTMHGQHIGKDGPRKGGMVSILYTPELGPDETYTQFSENPAPHQWFRNVTWDDVESHVLTPEQKAQILASIPPHERDMRSKGIPILGGARVYPVDEKDITVTPFSIPRHYLVGIGIDFGFEHPFAAVKGAYDPDHDVIYIIEEYVIRHMTPPVHVAALNGMGHPEYPVFYPHDGDGKEKGSGETLIRQYEKSGLSNTVKFRNPDGTIYREPGVMDILERMQSGRLKIFSTCQHLFQELRLYHRRDGRIVDASDDALSAMRYLCGMLPTAGVQPGARKKIESFMDDYYQQLDKYVI